MFYGSFWTFSKNSIIFFHYIYLSWHILLNELFEVMTQRLRRRRRRRMAICPAGSSSSGIVSLILVFASSLLPLRPGRPISLSSSLLEVPLRHFHLLPAGRTPEGSKSFSPWKRFHSHLKMNRAAAADALRASLLDWHKFTNTFSKD